MEAVWKMKTEILENRGSSGKLDRVYLTIREVAAYIKVSRPTIYSWIAKGAFPFKYYLIESSSIKHRSYRFLKEDIDAWMDGNQKIPAGVEYAAIS